MLMTLQWHSEQLYTYLEPQDPYVNEGPSRIDSAQNGILLAAGLHILWDAWVLSICPVTLQSTISHSPGLVE